MLTLKEFMELVDYHITEGSEYYINDMTLYSLDSWNGKHDGHSFTIIFDPQDNQRVYMVEACDYANDRAYRIADPSLKLDKQAWDGVEYVDLESDDDFIQKGIAIKAGESYDTRVVVPLDLDDDTLFELMRRAHEADITLNKLVEQILQEVIDRETAV